MATPRLLAPIARLQPRGLVRDVPAGQHRLTLDNIGGDWAVVDWLAFLGKFLEAR